MGSDGSDVHQRLGTFNRTPWYACVSAIKVTLTKTDDGDW